MADFPALDPSFLGILSGAAQGMSLSGPSPMPRSMGQVLGGGLSSAITTYQTALEGQRRAAQTQALIDLEQQKLKQAQAQFDLQQRILGGVGLVPTPIQGAPGALSGGSGSIPALSGGTAPGAPTQATGGFPFSLEQIAAMKLAGMPDLTATYNAAHPPGIAARPGAPIVDPRTGQIIANPAPVPTPGIAYIPDKTNASGWKAVPVPQAAQAAAAQEEAVTAGREAGKAPYEPGTVNTEGAPTLMTRQQQIEVATGKPMPRPGFPVESKRERVGRMESRLEILQREAADQMKEVGKVQPELQREIDNTKKQIPGLRLQDQSQAAANTEAGKEFIAEMRKNYSLLRDVPATLANMERAKALAAGEAKKFMGPVGEWKLEATKFLRANVPGMEGIQTPAVTGAEEVRSAMFNQVMDNLKKMDAQPSQYQQKVMQDAFGTLGSDPAALPKMLDVFGDILRNRVAIHNQTVDSAEKRGTTFPYEVRIKLPEPNVESKSQTFDTKPPAAQFKGKRIRDKNTGAMFESDGMSWRPVK